MTMWRMRIACWLPKDTNTHSEYNPYCFPIATMIARTCLSITLYVNCQSNLLFEGLNLPVSHLTLVKCRRLKPYNSVWHVELVRNLVAHGDARAGKWRGNWRMEWVASTLTPPTNVVYPALLKLMRTPRLPAVDWTDVPTDLNGLVRFGERRNLVSARVPSRSARAILRKVTGCLRDGFLCISSTLPIRGILSLLSDTRQLLHLIHCREVAR